MKMTEDIEKATLPGAKDVYRLYLSNGEPYVDLICQRGDEEVVPGKIITCIHPTDDLKRVNIKPTRVEKLHNTWLENGKINYKHEISDEKVILSHPNVFDVR